MNREENLPQESVNIREEILSFAEDMEHALEEYDFIRCWENPSPIFIEDNLIGKVNELLDCTIYGSDEEVTRCAANVANIAMMIGLKWGKV